jgi:hypothetical protein
MEAFQKDPDWSDRVVVQNPGCIIAAAFPRTKAPLCVMFLSQGFQNE